MDEQAAAPGGNVHGSARAYEPLHGLIAERRVRLGAAIALALAVGFVVWLAVARNGNSSSPSTAASATAAAPGGAVGATGAHLGPVAANASELVTFAKGIKSPVYWAGPLKGFTYELTQTTSGKVYVRYLPNGVKAGDARATFLIVATYPYPKAFTALKNVAKGKAVTLPGGGLALVDTGYPKSVHVAFPGIAYQVEVYDPSPTRASKVAFSGNVKPVR